MAEIRLDVEYAHPAERVWRALIDGRIRDQWFIPGNLGTVVGGQYQLRPREGDGFTGPIDVEVLEVVEAQRLVMQWTGDKLHTEMTWALLSTSNGCRLSLVQTGFIGTPQSVRRLQLRQIYTTLFTDLLPQVLDQLAAGEVDLGGERPLLLHTAIPRTPRPDQPATAPIGFLRQIRERFHRYPPRWRTVGTGAAVLALLAFAVIVLVVGLTGGDSRHRASPFPQPLSEGAGVATPLGPAATVGGVKGVSAHPTPGTPVQAGGGPITSDPGRVGGTSTAPVVPVPTTGAASPTDGGGGGSTGLAATYQTIATKGAGAYTGQIVISVTGPGTVNGWTVVVTLGGNSKIKDYPNGAQYTQSGETVTFTPSGNDQVTPDQPVSFTFQVNRKNDGIQHPLTCTVNGVACSM